MTKIDDYLDPLHNGVWEVAIPKEDVTEPLSEEWKKSPINVPTPGTIASYRNGQYHVHETSTEWRVHLDRYDPKAHPMLHLIDDAPLFLMIGETTYMLLSEARGRSTNLNDKLKNQERFLKNGLIIGFFVILLGLSFIIAPEFLYTSIIGVIIPLIVILVGVVSIVKAFNWHPVRISDRKDLRNGGIMVLVAIILWAFPILFWSLILLLILGVWMLLSAIMLLNRVRKGKSAVPEGFYSRLAIAVISLILVVAMFFAPVAILKIFMIIAGVIIILIGCILISATLKLRGRSKKYPNEMI